MPALRCSPAAADTTGVPEELFDSATVNAYPTVGLYISTTIFSMGWQYHGRSVKWKWGNMPRY